MKVAPLDYKNEKKSNFGKNVSYDSVALSRRYGD